MKLLNRTVKNYLLYSALLVILCTPLFYFTIEYLFAHKMDEELLEHKAEFNKTLVHVNSVDDLNLLCLMNKEFLLIPSSASVINDSIYSQDLYDSAETEMVPHRILRTGINVLGHQYELYIRESMVGDFELIGAIMGIELILLILLLIGSVIINRSLSRKIWSPFYNILDQLKKYNIDQDPALNLPSASTAEFRALTEVISQLVKKNHEAYLNQKEFTENASHEMQTPLAICRTKLELMAQTEELTEEQAGLVESLLDATDRLTRLNKNLLLLSRIENHQFLEKEEIDLKGTVLKIIDSFAGIVKEKQLSIANSIDALSPVSVNRALLEILISNMLSNAIRHSSTGSKIIVEGTKQFFKVSNPGDPLEHPEKIFQRFHRESRSSFGSGLGLSIVKKICDISGFEISYLHASNRHEFKVTFC